MPLTFAYAAPAAGAPLARTQIERRVPGLNDVLIEILYCGICHTDVSFSLGHFPGSVFPVVPGHEITGRVIGAGTGVIRHKIGDIVGVGCVVDSCRRCRECNAGLEQYCDFMVPTYGGLEADGKTRTNGGYSALITVDEAYVVKIPGSLSPAGAAPLLCAGITTYSPLRHWKVGPGSRVGVVGLGGLGHVAVKLARAMGAEVTVFSTTEAKREDAMRLGAKEFAAINSAATFERLVGQFDLILNTVSANLNTDAFVSLLRRDGALIIVGVPSDPVVSVNIFGLLTRRKTLSSSLIGGIQKTQEMLDFCGLHGIEADIELIRMDQVNEAFARIPKSDVRYRFVIDLASEKRAAR